MVAITTTTAARSTQIRLVSGAMKPCVPQHCVGSTLRVQEVEADTELRVGVRGVLVFASHVVRILVFLIASGFGPLGVEQTEAVGDHRLQGLLFDSLRRRHKRCRLTRGQGNITLVVEEPDPAALVLRSRHHASASKRGVADRVCVEVGVESTELNIDDDKVGDVLHVVTQALLRQSLGDSVTNKDVASDATCDLVINVAMDAVLTFSPVDFDLKGLSEVLNTILE